MSTSSLSRSEFIDLRSLNNLVVWILSDLPVTFSIFFYTFQTECAEDPLAFLTTLAKPISLHIVCNLSPGEMKLEYIWHRLWICLLCNLYWCDTSRHSVHFLAPFRNICTYLYTASAQSNPVSSAWCVLSHGCDKLDIRWYTFTRCKMDLDDCKQWHDRVQ